MGLSRSSPLSRSVCAPSASCEADFLASQEHPAVLESAAVASPDAQRGEIVKAFIILSAEYEEIMRGKGQKEVDDLILEIQVRRRLVLRSLFVC